jgi:hypothetical protein
VDGVVGGYFTTSPISLSVLDAHQIKPVSVGERVVFNDVLGKVRSGFEYVRGSSSNISVNPSKGMIYLKSSLHKLILNSIFTL